MKITLIMVLFCCFVLPVAGQSDQIQMGSTGLPDELSASYSNQHLYRGRVFTPHNYHVVGSPNYHDLMILDHCQVTYDGILYKDVTLAYDVVLDQLIVMHPVHQQELILEKHLVDGFVIRDDEFVHIKESDGELTPGFYQIIYEGDTYTSFARHNKQIKRYSAGTILELRYTGTATYYVKVEGSTPQVISNQRDLFRLAAGNRSEVRRLLNREGLSFRSRPAEALAATLLLLDHLNF